MRSSNPPTAYKQKDLNKINQIDACIIIFMAVLSTIVKIWNQPWCLILGEWIKKYGIDTK